MRLSSKKTIDLAQREPAVLSEYFEDHLFGCDAVMDEVETRERLRWHFSEEEFESRDFDHWFQEIREDRIRFAKRPKPV